MRGYSVFIILQELMHRTFVETHGRAPRRHEIPRPCDHFDLIIGTGTGGLIAIMLGRLRLDLETCKEVYVRMTRKVFESDKTIRGIPYRSTLFKASKLEEAIRECVRQHTVDKREGNDEEPGDNDEPMSPMTNRNSLLDGGSVRRHQSNASTMSFSARGLQSAGSGPGYRDRAWPGNFNSYRMGDSNAKMYDRRENRTKTAITAVYRNTPPGGPPALLRSYDSRKEPPPEFNCTIWQAGRATCATGLAFKPIQIGQSQFIDEGHGKFNPAPIVLDEATVNEWPGREVGVFVSVGTGKRPPGTDNNSHIWYEELLGGEFIEAKRKLIAKIEGCEETHKWMLSDGLALRNVSKDVYYRLNVEVGVGDFGMNEWQALSDISTSTRRYLARAEVSQLTENAAARLARVYLQKRRDAGVSRAQGMGVTFGLPRNRLDEREEPAYPSFTAELPAEAVPLAAPGLSLRTQASRLSYEYDGVDTLQLPATVNGNSPRASADRVSAVSALSERVDRMSVDSGHPPNSRGSLSAGAGDIPRNNGSPRNSPRVVQGDRFVTHAPTPTQYRTARGDDKIAIISADDRPSHPFQPHNHAPPLPPRGHERTESQASVPGIYPAAQDNRPVLPPPLPPKTPLPGSGRDERRSSRMESSGEGGRRLRNQGGKPVPPYPLDDVPPIVNMARKPEGWPR